MVTRRCYIAAISLLLILLLYNGCSNPLIEPYENLLGHWISEDGKRHFYFSEKGRLVIIDINRKIFFDDVYHMGIVEEKTGNKIKKTMHLYFYEDFFGKNECWFTFSEDKKRINSTAFGILNYVDEKQEL